MQKIRALVDSYKQEFETLIAQTIDSKAEMAETIAAHILAKGGKRLRPGLAIASHLCLGEPRTGLIPLALSMEMLHAASLLHDDVIDAGMLRRGSPTANVQWGNKRAILAGDFLFSRAFQFLQTYGGNEIVTRALQTALDLTEGEFL
ncbi:MAG: polyprenyl synthetase family protein, partial [Pseudomonadota bacterium]